MVARSRANGVTGVVVRAPAGVGKSRLAREALTQAELEGARIAWVQATRAAASVPLGPFAGVIPIDVRSDDQFELLRRSVESLRDLAGGGQLAVGVDDAHLLDATSAALVLQLANSAAAFVLATVRSGEPCPDAIESLWKDAGATRLELSTLSEQETRELVEAVVGGPIEERAQTWIWETSEGNALYAHELALGMLEKGILTQVSGMWRLLNRAPVSASLAEIISARLAGVAAAERRLLELLALGEPLRLGESLELIGAEPLKAAEGRELITIDGPVPDAEVRLAHPLYGEVIGSALGSLQARELRLELAAVVQARAHLTPEDSLRVCAWLIDAGEAPPARMLVEAARAANLSGAPELGADLASRAVTAGAGVDAVLVLARSHAINKRFEAAESLLAQLEGQIDSQDVALGYLLQRIRGLYWGLRRPDEARTVYERAQGWWSDPAWRRRLDVVWLELAALLDGWAGTVDRAQRSAALLADESLEEGFREEIELVHAMNLFYSGRVVEAYAMIGSLRPEIPLSGHHAERALIGWCLVSFESGQAVADLETEMTSILARGVRAGDRAACGLSALTLGGLALVAGRYRDATRWLAEAELQFEHRDTFGALMIARAFQVGVACFTGDERVEEAMQRCQDALQGHEPLPNQIPYLMRAHGWARVALGDRMGAQRLLLDAAARLEYMPLQAAELYYEAIRAGAPAATVAGDVSALRERCDARLMTAYADHITARADDDGRALLAVAEEFAQIGVLRYATEAAADAARSFLDAGRHDSARRAAARSREFFLDGQGGELPVIEGLTGGAVELSPREAQLVELAKLGLSNPQIAERLVLSKRTVESHLYRAMQKLGVSDRRDL
ncbi:MAG TPA: helix-turn-helix transcriptional regulator [Solirubrobacteraceae bacterium]|nr:helix-turn-helix transcriptional regulator [Solirubrobacteraceae bacterium]